VRLDGDDLTFRDNAGLEAPAEDAAGVDIDGVVEEQWLGNRRMSIDHKSPAGSLRPSLGGRQAELVCLAGRFGLEGETHEPT